MHLLSLSKQPKTNPYLSFINAAPRVEKTFAGKVTHCCLRCILQSSCLVLQICLSLFAAYCFICLHVCLFVSLIVSRFIYLSACLSTDLSTSMSFNYTSSTDFFALPNTIVSSLLASSWCFWLTFYLIK